MDPIVKSGSDKLTPADVAAWLEAHVEPILSDVAWLPESLEGIGTPPTGRNIMEKDGLKTGPTDLANENEQVFG